MTWPGLTHHNKWMTFILLWESYCSWREPRPWTSRMTSCLAITISLTTMTIISNPGPSPFCQPRVSKTDFIIYYYLPRASSAHYWLVSIDQSTRTNLDSWGWNDKSPKNPKYFFKCKKLSNTMSPYITIFVFGSILSPHIFQADFKFN